MISDDTNANSLSALITLLQDEDLRVASLAMEQFLNLGLAEETVAEFQEAQDPRLRKRIHQLSGILVRRRARQAFLEAVANEGISTWEGVLGINVLYDPQCNRTQVDEYIQALAARIEAQGATGPRLAALMREEEFTVPDEDTLDVELYLADCVVETKYGSPAILCAIAQAVGQRARWNPSIVLHEGRFCLMDRNGLLIDPTEGWHLSRIETDAKIHPCSRKDLWLGILSQLFLVSLVEGHLRDLYHFGDLLSSLNKAVLEESLPYPLGRNRV